MMTRYHSRKHISRTPHTSCTKRLTIWYTTIYYIRSILFPRLFLGILSRQLSPYARTRWVLTPCRNYNPGPLWSPTSKYCCLTRFWGHSYLSPPQHHSRATKTSYPSLIFNNPFRILLHIPPGFRILRSPLYNCRRSIRSHLFRSNWLPWTSCNYWLNFPGSMPLTSSPISFHIWTPLRVWSRCMILTLCRCGLTIPIYFNLLMRILIFLVQC